jgi:hypothetical protein
MAAVTHLDHVDSQVGQQFKTGVIVVGKPHAVISLITTSKQSRKDILWGNTRSWQKLPTVSKHSVNILPVGRPTKTKAIHKLPGL